jgi:hypothetical protein
VLPSDLRPLCPRAARAALRALCPGSTPGSAPSLAVRAVAWPRHAPMPSADSCLPISGDPSSRSPIAQQAGLPGSVLVPSTPRRPLYQTHPQGVTDFVVACPLVPGVSCLLAGACASPRVCVPRVLQPSPRDEALALPFSFGLPCLERGLAPPSTKTCPAHTARHEPRGSPRRLHGFDTYGGPLLGRPSWDCWRWAKKPTAEEETSGASTPTSTKRMAALICMLAACTGVSSTRRASSCGSAI